MNLALDCKEPEAKEEHDVWQGGNTSMTVSI